MYDLGDLDWLSLTFSRFVVFNRLDSFFTISTQRNLYVSKLFLVSLVPWIDKPWGNTLREKLHEPCACGIQIGALRSVNREVVKKEVLKLLLEFLNITTRRG